MQRKSDGRSAATIWVERIVWNVLAATVLAAMISVLLFSLEWLDEIDPEAAHGGVSIQHDRASDSDRAHEDRPTRVARVNGPSG